MTNVGTTFIGVEGAKKLSDCVPKAFARAGGCLPQQRLEFGEHQFNRVEIGAVGREVEDAGADGGDCLGDTRHLMCPEIIHDDDVARREHGSKELLDIGHCESVRAAASAPWW